MTLNAAASSASFQPSFSSAAPHSNATCASTLPYPTYYVPPPITTSVSRQWHYEMRRDMQQILERVYLGPYTAAKSLSTLRQHRISHVVLLRDGKERSFIRPMYADEITYYVQETRDHPDQNVLSQFAAFCDYIHTVLSSTDTNLLVVCRDGISLSPTFMIALVMEQLSVTFDQAYDLVQSKRFCINPNDGFKQQLREYVPIYQARKTMLPSDPLVERKNFINGFAKEKHELQHTTFHPRSDKKMRES